MHSFNCSAAQVWPRFPVLGGWNFDLKVSYDMPVSSLILQHGVNGGKISLNIPLGPPFQDLYAEYISLTVALPTGTDTYECSVASWNVYVCILLRITVLWVGAVLLNGFRLCQALLTFGIRLQLSLNMWKRRR